MTAFAVSQYAISSTRVAGFRSSMLSFFYQNTQVLNSYVLLDLLESYTKFALVFFIFKLEVKNSSLR